MREFICKNYNNIYTKPSDMFEYYRGYLFGINGKPDGFYYGKDIKVLKGISDGRKDNLEFKEFEKQNPPENDKNNKGCFIWKTKLFYLKI